MVSGQVGVGASAASDFAALATDLKAAGAKGLQRELHKGLSRTTKPVRAAVFKSAADNLPKGGGRGRRRTRLVSTGATITNAVSGREHAVKVRRTLGGKLAAPESVSQRVQRASFKASVRNSGQGASVRFTAGERAGHKIDLYALNAGKLRHPLFGDRGHWYSQAVRPGWFTSPIEAKASTFERELRAAVDAVVADINGA